MNRRLRNLIVGLFSAALVATSTPAGAETAAIAGKACRGTSGVTVIVDYYAYGGRGIDTRCAPGNPANGLVALTGAGLPYTFVPNQPGLVCTINGVPDPCNGAPVRAYWSYWHLRADGSWAFSSTGAGSYDPAPGATEGWAFGNGKPPRKPKPPASTGVPLALLAGSAASQYGRRPRRR